MLDEMEINYNGNVYRWRHDPDQMDAAQAVAWTNDEHFAVDGRDLVHQLNRHFVDHHLDKLLDSCEIDDITRFIQIANVMGGPVVDWLGLLISALDQPASLEAEPRRRAIVEALRPFARMVAAASEQVTGSHPFADSTLRDWMTQAQVQRPDWLHQSTIVVTGCGPFRLMDWSQFLEHQQFEVETAALPDAAVLVVGREDFDRALIDMQIDLREGKALRVLSQEMLVCVLATGRDPFCPTDDATAKVLDRFRDGHAALEFVSQGWKGWVKTWVQPRSATTGAREYSEWLHSDSLLTVCGYHVGKRSRLSVDQRRNILEFVFKRAENAPNCAHWGEPAKADRLRCIAEHLAQLVQSNSRHTGKDMSTSLNDWREDLSWLKEKFYRGHMRFHWPDTSV